MEFVSPDAGARVRAANVRATLAAFKLLPKVGRKIAEKYGLGGALRADELVPVQQWLDALREIQQTVGPAKVKQVGRNIVENADFPPKFTDAISVLLALDDIYQLNHKGDVGHYRVKRLRDGTIEIRCETPYPAMFEWGLVDGICHHKRLGGNFAIEFTAGAPDADVTCTITVRRLV